MSGRQAALRALLLTALSVLLLHAHAQTYPAKPVRLVSPYPPGSGSDVIGRIYSPKLSDIFGRQFIIDNRAGGSGNIGAEVVAHATPDGYTLLLLNTSIASSQSLYKNLTFDVGRDFQAIAMLGVGSYLLVVNTSLPAKSVQELIALAKSRPGKLSYASTGTGGSLHLAMELFKMQAGIDMLHIPYKGSSASIPDLIGGQVDAMFGSTLSLLPHVRSGRMRALGITSAKRSAAAPDLPTIAESGLPGFEVTSWFALVGPKAMPRNLVSVLNSTVVKIAQMPDLVAALANQSTEPLVYTPGQTSAFIQDELVKWRKVVASAGIKHE